MSSQNVSTTLVYMAYNPSTGAYVTGDVANHTLRLVKDGTSAAPTNAAAEVDAVNAPGAYKVTLTAAETQFGTVWLGGKSSTANVVILPVIVTFEILPTALSGAGNVKGDMEEIAANAVAATNVSRANRDIIRGTCSSGSTTTAVCSSISTPASLTDVGQLIGRTIIFDSDTVSANLQGQASNITASTTGATPTITFTTMTHAPANGDTFVIV
jgi:hypothetical protein